MVGSRFLALLLMGHTLAASDLKAQLPPLHTPGLTPIRAESIVPFSATYSSYAITARRAQFMGRGVFSLVAEIVRPDRVILDHMGWDASSLEMVYRQSPFFAKGPEFVLWRFDGGRYEITRVPLTGGQPVFAADSIATPVFEAAFFGIVLAALPLRAGFEVRLPFLEPERDSDAWKLSYGEYHVIGRETIELNAGIFDTWVVEGETASYGKERLYVTHRPPYVVRRIRFVGTSREFTSNVLSYRVDERQ